MSTCTESDFKSLDDLSSTRAKKEPYLVMRERLSILMCFAKILYPARSATRNLQYKLRKLFKFKNADQGAYLESSSLYVLQVEPKIGRYEHYSTIYSIYAVIRNSLPMDYLAQLLGLEKPANCYLPGRAVSNPTLAKSLSTMFTGLIFFWRIWQALKTPDVQDMCLFLTQNEIAIERQYEMIEREYEQFEDLELTEVDVVLRNIMCYQVWRSGKLIYKLRPNRNRLARKLLIDRINFIINLFTAALMCLGAFLILVSTYEIFSDFGYLRVYSKCSPELYKLYLENKLSIFSVSMTKQKAFVIVVDMFENTTLWLDTICGIMNVLLLAIFIHYDLELYWDRIHEKLVAIHNQLVEQNYFARRQISPKEPMSLFYYDGQRYFNVARFNDRIKEVLMEMGDFFHQFHTAGSIVSNIVSMGVIYWLASFFALSYFGLVLEIEGNLMIVRVVQTAGFIGFSASVSHLWIINRKLVKTHLLLRSIIAHSIPLGMKVKYLSLLSLYRGHEGTSFKILGRYPLIPKTYLSILSWTFGCIIIIEKFMFADKRFH